MVSVACATEFGGAYEGIHEVENGDLDGHRRMEDKQDSWIAGAIRAHGLEITTVELVEYMAPDCLLEDVRFKMALGSFEQATPIGAGESSEGTFSRS